MSNLCVQPGYALSITFSQSLWVGIPGLDNLSTLIQIQCERAVRGQIIGHNSLIGHRDHSLQSLFLVYIYCFGVCYRPFDIAFYPLCLDEESMAYQSVFSVENPL